MPARVEVLALLPLLAISLLPRPVQAVEAQGRFEIETRLMAPATSSGGELPLKATLVMEPYPDGGGSPRVAPIDVPGSVEVELPDDGVWKVGVRLPGFWSADTTISSTSPRRIEMPLHPTGALSGRIHTSHGALPPELAATFAPGLERGGKRRRFAPGRTPTSPEDSSSGEVGCPVREDGGWTCDVPAGLLDLRLEAAGFASVFRWNVEVSAGRSSSLGDVPLQPGAAVFGFVQAAEGLLDPGAVEVELAPASVDDSPDAARFEQLVQDTTPDRHGFFQFRDLTAGMYVISVRGPDFAPVRLKPILVLAGRETDLGEPIVLEQPALLTVRLDPPSSHYGKPWNLQLVAQDQRLPHLEGETDALGTWFSSEPVPGLYRLLVGGPDGERWLSRDVEVSGGPQAVDVDLPHVAVEGTISGGGEPVRARITFSDPADRRSILLYSDHDGRFLGWLPEEGPWSVSVLFERDGAQQEIDVVTVEAPPGGPAQLDLEVPDTTLAGIVRGADGEPAERVTVSAWDPDTSVRGSSTLTDQEGRFRFRGLPEGRYGLTAFRGGESGTVTATVASTGELREVELRLLGVRSWSGRVVSRDGPVPGAEVWIRAEVAAPRQMPYVQATTGPLGDFTARVPADSEWLDVMVLAFGRGARLMRWAPESQPEIFVDDLGGSLALRLEGVPLGAVLLGHGEGWFHVAPLRRWARVHGLPAADGADLVLPAMEPGSYRLCSSLEKESCDSAFLSPDGLTELTLEADHEESRLR